MDEDKYYFNRVNPLECRNTYSATSNDMKLVHWPLMGGGLLHLVQRGGAWAGLSSGLGGAVLVVPNVTLHPSTSRVPITVLLYIFSAV